MMIRALICAITLTTLVVCATSFSFDGFAPFGMMEKLEQKNRPIDGGYGKNIKWKTLDEAIKNSEELNRPIMLIIHETWCKACKMLAKQFRRSKFILEMSEFFEMCNIMDEEIPRDNPALVPDGEYYPRILFIGPDQKVHADIINPKAAKKFLYYYYDAESVEISMAKALRRFYNVLDEDDTEL